MLKMSLKKKLSQDEAEFLKNYRFLIENSLISSSRMHNQTNKCRNKAH